MTRIGQATLYRPGHPLAQVGGAVIRSRFVLFEKIGPGAHACHWCGTLVRWVAGKRGNARGVVVADHLDFDWTNDDSSNLVPSCGPCNAHRKRSNVREDEDHFVRSDGRRVRTYEIVCPQCRRPFWGRAGRRFCSHSCANRAH